MVIHELETVFVDRKQPDESAPITSADFSLKEANTNQIPAYPMDKEFGIVHPVYVTLDDFPNRDPYALGTHFHHLNFEDRREELSSPLGRALRYSVGQRLPATIHFSLYPDSLHSLTRQPEGLPTDEIGRNRSVMLHLGRVISRQSVEFRKGGYAYRVLSDEEHAFLSDPRITFIEGARKHRPTYIRHKIGLALVGHALNEYLESVVTAKQMEKYLRAYLNGERYRITELGNLLIRNSLDESINSVQPLYDKAVDNGMVNVGQPKLRKAIRNTVPEHAFDELHETIAIALQRLLDEQVTSLQTGVDRVQLALLNN